MAATLPVPIHFELPEGWHAVPPDSVGAQEVAFVALRQDHRDQGFTPTITIGAELRPDLASLTEIADESVDTLARTAGVATVADRAQIGAAETPGLTQTVRIREQVGGAEHELVQSQVLLSMIDVEDGGKRVVVRFALTATAVQFDDLVGDFQAFVASVRTERSGA
jgi:hypothetical protein